MKAMLGVLVIGAAVTIATAVSGAEWIRAYSPFAALSTGVLLLAYWAVDSDHTPAGHVSHKRAA